MEISLLTVSTSVVWLWYCKICKMLPFPAGWGWGRQNSTSMFISYKCMCVYNYLQRSLIFLKKKSVSKNCSSFWVPATLSTKTDLKSYHTFRISELVEGWLVAKGKDKKKTTNQNPTASQLPWNQISQCYPWNGKWGPERWHRGRKERVEESGVCPCRACGIWESWGRQKSSPESVKVRAPHGDYSHSAWGRRPLSLTAGAMPIHTSPFSAHWIFFRVGLGLGEHPQSVSLNLIRGILSDRPLCNRHGNTSFASHRWAAISPSWPKEPDSRTAARGQSSPDLSPWTTGLSLSGCSQPGKPSRFHCDREGLAQRKKTAFSLKSQEIFLGQLNQRGCYC